MTTFQADLELALVSLHPKNPRRRAVADDELVASVKTNGLVQPLIVAPVPGPEGWEGDHARGYSKPGMGVSMGKYVLIAGHRRLAALKKLKAKTAPAVIREDLVTEGQQVEAMLIENGRREDLTPVEEAEGYAQLQLFGYKAKDIATAVGRDPKTVNGRLKLLKLTKPTQDKLHKGQMTLEDAAVFVEFADDDRATAQLDAASKGDASNFKYMAARLRSEKKQAAEADRREAGLLRSGATKFEIPEDQSTWDWVRENGYVNISHSWESPVAKFKHTKKCHGFYRLGNHVTEICTDPSLHDAELSEAQQAEQAAAQRALEEADAAELAEAAALEVRIGTIVDHVKGSKLDGGVVDVVRWLLPGVLRELLGHEGTLGAFHVAAGVPEEKRWRNSGGSLPSPTDQGLFDEYAESLTDAPASEVLRVLTCALLATNDARFTHSHGWGGRPEIATRYTEFLDVIVDHPFCDVDDRHRARWTSSDEETAS